MKHTSAILAKASKAIQSRRFLLRLMVWILLAISLPGMCLAVFFFRAEARNLQMSVQRQMLSAGSSVLNAFDDHLSAVAKFVYKTRAHSNLVNAALIENVADEIEELNTLANLALQLPFADYCGIYNFEIPDVIYLSTGRKYDLSIYARKELNADAESLLALLCDGTASPAFSVWGSYGSRILYAVPIKNGAGATSCVALIVLSEASLMNSFKNILNEQYAIADVRDASGGIIYLNKSLPFARSMLGGEGVSIVASQHESTRYMIVTGVSAKGYQISFYQNYNSVYQVNRFTGVIIAVCISVYILLAATIVQRNFLPLQRVLEKIIHDGRAHANLSDELTQLADTFEKQKADNERLRLAYRRQLYQNLLDGSAQGCEEKMLGNDFSCFFLIVADVSAIGEEQLLKIQNEEYLYIRKAPHFVLLCHQADDSSSDYMAVSASIHANYCPRTRIGVSNVHAHIERMHIAYIEAATALSVLTDREVAYAQDVSFAPGLSLNSRAVDMAQVVHTFKAQSSGIYARIRQDFTLVEKSDASESEKRFACFRLVDFYHNAAEKAGILLNLHPLCDALLKKDIPEIAKTLCCTIENFYSLEMSGVPVRQDSLPMQMLSFIDASFSDPLLDVNAIAEHFDISVSKVSQVLRNSLQINLRTYIRGRRIQAAKKLLRETDTPVNLLAEQVGFTSSSYFISVFKEQEKITPAAYRAAQYETQSE